VPDRLPPLNALRAFEAAARLLSLKKAAAELNVTPAAISHQIKLLEEHAGRALLVRKPRAIELTDAARAALPRLSAGFDQLADAARLLREAGPESTLTVSVAPSFATCWLMPRLHRFLSAEPGVDVRVTARTRQSTSVGAQSRREAETWLADADVAVLLSNGQFPGYHVERLVRLSVTPLASPRLLAGRTLAPADLRVYTLIHDDIGKLYDGRDFWDLWLDAAGVSQTRLKHGVHFSHTVLALEAAEEGVGIVATLPELARPQLEDGRLIAPFGLRVHLPYAYYLVANESSLGRAAVRAFVVWLRAQAADAG
jgi:LysR family transcriptional regulator, glycine cleavage system transcriptional activator